MTLKDRSKIMQSPNSYTQYVTIPSAVARDSQYPFKKDEEIEIIVDPQKREIKIVSTKDTSMKVSSESEPKKNGSEEVK